MKVRLKILENNKLKSFIFHSLADARRFLDFVNIYYNESGAGNGHSAYWPNYFYIPCSRFLPFTEGLFIPFCPLPCLATTIDTEKNMLISKMITQMLFSILKVRLAENNPDLLVSGYPVVNTKQGIEFDVGYLPPREQPQVGDMYRIPRDRFGGDPNVLKYSEGRIIKIKDFGATFKVLPCQFERPKCEEPKYFEIKSSQAIKINDWINI